MSGLILKLKSPLTERIDLSGVSPAALVGQNAGEISRIRVSGGPAPIDLGDVFYVSGTPGETITIEGGSERMDDVGAGLAGGTVIVFGDVGARAGLGMTGGRLVVRGCTGPLLGSGMKAGVIHVAGSAGDQTAAARPGERFGMSGGIVLIDGDCGARAGDRMRRGTIVVRGRCGPSAGSRMMGGTLRADGGFAHGAGALMRRGSLIAPSVDRMLATFADCGVHDLGVLRLLNRFLAETLGPEAPKPLPATVRRFAGDLATIGRGEILLTV